MNHHGIATNRPIAQHEAIEVGVVRNLASENAFDGRRMVLTQPTEALLDEAVLPALGPRSGEVHAGATVSLHVCKPSVQHGLKAGALGVVEHSVRAVHGQYECRSGQSQPGPEGRKCFELKAIKCAKTYTSGEQKVLKSVRIGSLVRRLFDKHQLRLTVIAILNTLRVGNFKPANLILVAHSRAVIQ